MPFKNEELYIASQLAWGMNHIHKMELCLRDLKPENRYAKQTKRNSKLISSEMVLALKCYATRY